MNTQKLIIIGGGPAACTAAVYAARAELAPLLFEGFMAGGVAAGGQLTTTSIVENFPGFDTGIEGPELMLRMRNQAQRFGTNIITETVESVDLTRKPFSIATADKKYEADAIILATGATAQRLYVKGEDLLWDKGISACAVCDGALPLFRDKPLLVVGGGDTACEEAHFLTKFASKVYMAVRRDVLRASKHMQKQVQQHPKIEILWKTQVEEAQGDTLLQSVVLFESDNASHKRTLEVSGLFYAIGHTPNTAFLKNTGIVMNDIGYINTRKGTTETSVEGVFACGDVQDAHYRQAITAAGSGCMAAMDAERYLTAHEN